MFEWIFLNFLVTTKTCGQMRPDTLNFFPNISGNLTKITWAHGVNNKKLLGIALFDPAVMMIEADVIIGTLDGNVKPIPVMGHPPAITSDLSLENVLENLVFFNKNDENKFHRKGLKLDFKSIHAFENSLPLLRQFDCEMTFPVWINADILMGPIFPVNLPVDAKRFLQGAESLTDITISVGWTTRYDSLTSGAASYTDANVQEMISVLKENAVSNNITFPVRAVYASKSLKQMEDLVKYNNSTLTIWSSSEKDKIDIRALRNLIFTIGVGKIYLDVPDSILKKLALDKGVVCDSC